MDFFKRTAFAALLGIVLCTPVAALADLMITPLRVVFENRDRSAVVTLVNTSSSPNSYRMGWKWMRMDDEGRYRNDTDHSADPHDVSNIVVFSPRQVTVEPNGRQRVRLSLRRPPDLPPGEYRAHLVFSRLPKDFGPDDINDQRQSARAQLNILLGFSIPVIVRNGAEKPLEVSITGQKFSVQRNDKTGEQASVINVALKRTSGVYSSYGRIKIFLQEPGQKERQIGILNNVSLFSEIQTRKAAVPLSVQGLPSNGKLRVVYEGLGEYAGRVFDEKVFTVSP